MKNGKVHFIKDIFISLLAGKKSNVLACLVIIKSDFSSLVYSPAN